MYEVDQRVLVKKQDNSWCPGIITEVGQATITNTYWVLLDGHPAPVPRYEDEIKPGLEGVPRPIIECKKQSNVGSENDNV